MSTCVNPQQLGNCTGVPDRAGASHASSLVIPWSACRLLRKVCLSASSTSCQLRGHPSSVLRTRRTCLRWGSINQCMHCGSMLMIGDVHCLRQLGRVHVSTLQSACGQQLPCWFIASMSQSCLHPWRSLHLVRGVCCDSASLLVMTMFTMRHVSPCVHVFNGGGVLCACFHRFRRR